jgi:menaquinone-dependent protoporphyrinogen oxidase
MTLLVSYSSLYGSTQEMAQTLATFLRDVGYETQLCPIEDVTSLTPYTAIILGSPIHCGLWARPMHQFLYQMRSELRDHPVYTWITCLRVLEEDGYVHAQKYYVTPEIRELPLIRSIEVFAGRIVPTQLAWSEYYDFQHRYDGSHEVIYKQGDYRDWARFCDWARFIVSDLQTLSINPNYS